MPVYELVISAYLENLRDLQPLGGFNDPYYPYMFKLKCGNCGEISEKEKCFKLFRTPTDVEIRLKCKLCESIGTVRMIPEASRPLTYGNSHLKVGRIMMAFDCKGFEPVRFSFTDAWNWKATSISDYNFIIDFSKTLEFAGYDRVGICQVGVYNVEAVFRVMNEVGIIAESMHPDDCTEWFG